MQTDQRLVEIDFGDWEGLTQREIEHNFPEQWKKWLADPTMVKAGGCGESAADVFGRMKAVFAEHGKDNHQNVLVVSHNTAMRLFIAGTLGMPFVHYRKMEMDNAGVCVLDMKSTAELRWKIGNGLTIP
jgi:broad specificity phosphatase PhoE